MILASLSLFNIADALEVAMKLSCIIYISRVDRCITFLVLFLWKAVAHNITMLFVLPMLLELVLSLVFVIILRLTVLRRLSTCTTLLLAPTPAGAATPCVGDRGASAAGARA